MKKSLFILLAVISIGLNAQNDSIIKLNLRKCHNEFKTGTSLVVGGVLISTCMYAGISNNLFSTPLKKGLFFASVGMAMIGYIIQIDSHKFIYKAGLNENGVTIKVQIK